MILIVVGIAFFASLAWSLLPRRYSWMGHIGCSLTTLGVSLQFAGGHITNKDALWILVVGLVISILMRWIFYSLRERQKNNSSEGDG